jgi:type VII secretion protein EccB
MQTRREQVRAYRFVTRRVVSALLSGEPETNDLPMRRLSIAIFGSVMVAVLVFAAVGAYGLLKSGHGEPTERALIIERDSGARYVYLDDHVLYPVLNYASARLLLGQPNPTVKTLSAASLRGIPRGRALGIPGAPDSLPDPGSLLRLPWSLCSAPRSHDETVPMSQLLIGPSPAGGTDLGSSALLAASGRAGGQQYLLWRPPGKGLERLRLGPEVAGLLGLHSDPVVAGQAALDGIPPGPDLVKITLNRDGKPSGKQVNGVPADIGQVYKVDRQFYVMLNTGTDTGLVPIGDVTRRLLTGKGTDQAIVLDKLQAGDPVLTVKYEQEGYPNAVPLVYQTTSRAPATCLTYGGAEPLSPNVSLTVYDTDYDHLPGRLKVTGDPGVTQIQRGVQSVDRVVVDGGRGALVRALPAPGATVAGTTTYLITDQGRKFPVGDSPDVLASLGYGGVAPVPVSAALLALLPSGPMLDPQAARAVNETPTQDAEPPPVVTTTLPPTLIPTTKPSSQAAKPASSAPSGSAPAH